MLLLPLSVLLLFVKRNNVIELLASSIDNLGNFFSQLAWSLLLITWLAFALLI